MPKITLRNTKTGKDEDFEPVDAREILSQTTSDYEATPEARKAIGLTLEPDGDISVPQLQGGDAEMQTGLSIEKYGRSQVVKAAPGDPAPRVVESVAATASDAGVAAPRSRVVEAGEPKPANKPPTK